MATIMEMREVAAERAQIDAKVHGGTLLSAFLATVERHRDAEALRWKQGADWQSLSWRQYSEAVRHVALGLHAEGLERGEFVLIVSRNRPETHVAELGVLAAGGVPLYLYNALAPEQVAYIANHCEATVAFLENPDVLRSFAAIRHQLPHLRRIFLLEGGTERGDDWVSAWDQPSVAGRGVEQSAPGAFERLCDAVQPDDLATVIYTSGTTGWPKGVRIAHRSVLWNLTSMNMVLPPSPDRRRISYLPMAHVTGRLIAMWEPILNGGTVVFCPDPSQLFDLTLEVRPTWFMGVPRIWEKLHAGLTVRLAADPDPAHRALLTEAIEIGGRVAALRQRSEPVPPELEREFDGTASIRRGVLACVGLDNCEVAGTGAAPIEPGILRFFHALGLPLTEGWGMTELTAAVTVMALDRIRVGTVGYAIPGVEVRVAEDGELLVRCGCVTPGYHKDPELTASTIDAEGWLHTGDVGTIDDDGYVRIVDRKKELIITSGGKNISPAAVEQQLLRHPLIGQACAIGDRRKYVTALLVLDPDVAPAWARRHGIEAASISDLACHPEVLTEVERAVDEANQHLARVEQVKRFRLLPKEWTAGSGELTPTMKKRRRFIVEKYAREIEGMYVEG